MENIKFEINDTLKKIEHDISIIENIKPNSRVLDELREIQSELIRDSRRIDNVSSELAYVKTLITKTDRNIEEYINA